MKKKEQWACLKDIYISLVIIALFHQMLRKLLKIEYFLDKQYQILLYD